MWGTFEYNGEFANVAQIGEKCIEYWVCRKFNSATWIGIAPVLIQNAEDSSRLSGKLFFSYSVINALVPIKVKYYGHKVAVYFHAPRFIVL